MPDMSPGDRAERYPSRLPATREREAVIAQLSAGFADDRLSLEEFESRVSAAYRATTTTDLVALAADLPEMPAVPRGDSVGSPATVSYTHLTLPTNREV